MVHSADPVDSVLQQDVRVDRITEELLGVLRFWQGLCRSLGEQARVVVAVGLHRAVDRDVRAATRLFAEWRLEEADAPHHDDVHDDQAVPLCDRE